MKRLLLLPLLLGLIPSANAGIYYHPFYQNGVEIRCDDDEPRHAIFFKNGRAMLFEDDGNEASKKPAPQKQTTAQVLDDNIGGLEL